MFEGEIEYAFTIEKCKRVSHHQNRVRHLAIHGRECFVEIVRFANPKRLHSNSKLLSGFCGRIVALCHAAIVLIPQHCDPTKLRRRSLQQSKTFGGEGGGIVSNSRHSTAWMRKALDEPGHHRIARASGDYRWNARCFGSRN